MGLPLKNWVTIIMYDSIITSQIKLVVTARKIKQNTNLNMKYLYISLSMIINMKHPLFDMIPHGTTIICLSNITMHDSISHS